MKALAGRLPNDIYKGFFAVILAFLFLFFKNPKSVIAITYNVAAGDTVGLINSINSANSTHEQDTINLAPESVYKLTSINNNDFSSNGLPVINSVIIINGNESKIIRDSTNNFRLFTVLDSGNLILNNLILENGSNNDGNGGGGIWLGGNSSLKILESKIVSNYVFHPGSGGAIQKRGSGNLEIINTEISGNYAQNTAGAIYANHSGEIFIKNSTFNSNSTDDSGGAIRNHTGKLRIENSTFTNNQVLVNSYGLGGAIGNESGGQVNISFSAFNNNSAAKNGGFIYSNGTVSIDHSCISNNSNTAVYNSASSTLFAQNNYWGSPTGPSGAGPGTGDSVSSNVDFVNFLTSCSIPPEPSPTPSPSPSPSSPSPSPSPSSSLTPTVILPGMGGSWNTTALLTGQTGGVWGKTPFVKVYDNLRDTFLNNAGYTENANYFEFYYDWRQPVNALDDQLNDFLQNQVFTKHPQGTKINIVGHSLGGLIARSFAQNFDTDKINHLVTVGSPHEGAIAAYLAWTGAQIGDKFSWQWLPFQLYLHLHQGKYSSPVSAVQGLSPSLKNLLPIFEFVKDKPVNSLTTINYQLIDLKNNLTSGLIDMTTTIAGHENDEKNETVEWLNLGERTLADKLLSRWPDGRPISYEYTTYGDLTVLDKSSLITNTEQKIVDTSHVSLVETSEGIRAILDSLSLEDIDIATDTLNPPPYPSLVFWLHSPAQIKITLPDGSQVGPNAENLLVIPGATDGNYQLEIMGTGTGTYTLDIAQLTDTQELWHTLTGSITPDKVDNFNLNFNQDRPLPNPIVDKTGYDKLEQAKFRLSQLKLKSKLVIKYINTIVSRLKKTQYYPTLELLTPAISNIYSTELEVNEMDAVGQLLVETYAEIGQKYGHYLTPSRVQREINTTSKAKADTENKLKKSTNKPRAGILLDLAEKYLVRAQTGNNLYRCSADALVARILYSQASALR